VYFHLNEFDEALTFALGAGKLFDLSAKTEYVETMIGTVLLRLILIEAHCVDQYIATQTHTQDDLPPRLKDADIVMHDKDPRLEDVVERMFDRCIKDKEYKQVHTVFRSRLIVGTRGCYRSQKTRYYYSGTRNKQ